MLTILRNRPRAGVLHFIGLFGFPTLYSPPTTKWLGIAELSGFSVSNIDIFFELFKVTD